MQKYENIISYKCGCNDSIHSLAFGEKSEKKILKTEDYEKMECKECREKIKVQKKEILIIEDNKIKEKEVVN